MQTAIVVGRARLALPLRVMHGPHIDALTCSQPLVSACRSVWLSAVRCQPSALLAPTACAVLCSCIIVAKRHGQRRHCCSPRSARGRPGRGGRSLSLRVYIWPLRITYSTPVRWSEETRAFTFTCQDAVAHARGTAPALASTDAGTPPRTRRVYEMMLSNQDRLSIAIYPPGHLKVPARQTNGQRWGYVSRALHAACALPLAPDRSASCACRPRLSPSHARQRRRQRQNPPCAIQGEYSRQTKTKPEEPSLWGFPCEQDRNKRRE